MSFPVATLSPQEYPPLLHEIPDPPEQLYLRGELPPTNTILLTVVGSRTYTNYGRQVAETIIAGLRDTNTTIVSGLALGIDSIAHRAALDAGLHTLAVPGSGLDDSVIYPRRHAPLAHEILSAGGGLLSEYEPTQRATKWSFPERNRIMAGLSHAVLVIEAGMRSGTLITSRLATEYNRDVLTVPGSIFSEGSEGPHMLIALGATPVTSAVDIVEELGITMYGPQDAARPAATNHTSEEEHVLALLAEPRERDTLIRALDMDAAAAGTLLMQMEIDGKITDSGGMLSRAII